MSYEATATAGKASIMTDRRIRQGSAIGYRNGAVVWHGALDGLCVAPCLDILMVHQDDMDEARKVLE